MDRNLDKSANERFRSSLIHRYWVYQESNFQPWEKYLDRPNNEFRRPPVFLDGRKNIITNPARTPEGMEELFGLIPSGELHQWFCSMNSSQALALSILGNLSVENKLSILSELSDDDGIPLIGKEVTDFQSYKMEHKIDYFHESRRTSLDGFIPGDYQIAIECKFTEQEVGTCSRPRLSRSDSNYAQDFCNGSYSVQKPRKERCPLTENGVKYWEYIPYLFNWDANEDKDPCPMFQNYQLVRNILAACVKPDGAISMKNGHAILIYDERNPSCQNEGKILRAYNETKAALKEPRLLRKVSWQRILQYMRVENLLPWLTEQVEQKYGL